MGKISFWISAFIPKNVAGYTQTIPKGIHVNKTAVPLPGAARLVPMNLFKNLDAGYLSDQRGFDPKFGASSRMTSLIEFETGPLRYMRQDHLTSGTTEVDMVSGREIDFDWADMSRCRYTELKTTRVHTVPTGSSRFPKVNYPGAYTGNRSLTFDLDAAASDPLVWLAADINYVGRLIVAELTNGVITLMFDGKIDAFPAYDCYASDGNTTKVVFVSTPPPGNTVVDLLGPASRDVRGTAVFP